jgi:sterol desaturase/sphingolipid hydroxylase (fatty acid hydroxylase superfamily)
MIGMLPLAILGAGPEMIALNGITNIVVGLFQHANVDIRLGPLNWSSSRRFAGAGSSARARS